MKKTITSLALALTSFMLNATIITVSNNANTPGQYNNLQTAVNAAAYGDTLYVHGSPTSYGTVVIKTKLTLIGAGYKPSATQFNLRTEITQVNVDSAAFGTAAHGSNFYGLYIAANVTDYVNAGTNNLTFERCNIVGGGGGNYLKGKNYIFKNNILGGMTFYNSMVSGLFSNNFVIGQLDFTNGNNLGVILDHNIFEISPRRMSNIAVTNNIFFFSSISAESTNNNCSFTNNITVTSTSDILPYGTNSGSGNFNNVSPTALFVSTIASYQGFPAMLSYDWHLKTTCVGHNTGTDGTDIGMYGGSIPMPNLSGATNLIPQMTYMNVNTPIVAPSGTLNVNFKARKQD